MINMDKYFVYRHWRLDKNEVFYVGLGKIRTDDKATTYKIKHYRAYSKYKRNEFWKNITNKTKYKVEIYRDNLSKEEAIELEISLISIHGNYKNGGTLCNITDGGETVPDSLITVNNDPKCSQKVYQYSLNGNFVKEWESSNEIKRQLGFDNSVIRKAIKGKTKSPNISYNFQWFLEYKGEKIEPSDYGKTTLHKPVKLTKDEEVLIFKSRDECAKYFNVESYQITNAINGNFKFRKYKVENYVTD